MKATPGKEEERGKKVYPILLSFRLDFRNQGVSKEKMNSES